MSQAKPFLKWAGGKRQLLPEMGHHIPKDFHRYFEPFVGGGALFFSMGSDTCPARLNDINERLIWAYAAVKEDPGYLTVTLRQMEKEYLRLSAAGRQKLYLSVREAFNASRGDSHRGDPRATNAAARLIFLNKTGFNGLYRVNRRGEFNVPWGKYENPTICDAENLKVCSTVLQRAKMSSVDFEVFLRDVRKGDFVYADPPYAPVSDTADFVGYAKGGFTAEDQKRLRDVMLDLKRKGAHVLISNADVESVRKLYSKGFKMRRVEAKRNINRDASKRGAVGELLIW